MTSIFAELSASADIGTHEKVLELFRSFSPGRLLDAPGGSGKTAWQLTQLGFEVTAAELVVSGSLPKVSSTVNCDLNHYLPFKPGSFDYVCSIEGIEHLENPFHLIREFARVLRPGGRLVLTTPNTLVISSRLRFLLTGFFNKFPRPLDESRNDPSFHINPISYPELRFILRRCGFNDLALTTNRVKGKEWILSALFAPLIFPLTRLALAAEETEATRRINREVFRHLRSRAVLMGQSLIIVARKDKTRDP